mgnify:CR=1 FL=1
MNDMPLIVNNLANPLAGIGNLNQRMSESAGIDRSAISAPMLKSNKYEESAATLSENEVNTESNIHCGRTSIEEVIVELRQKYLTILKSIYWEFYEEGQCMPETVCALIESADRCLDYAEDPAAEMKDWEYIQSYLVSPKSLSYLSSLSNIPLFGRLFRQYFFEHQSLTYDILVNFIDAHEEASHMIQIVIENKEFTNRILKEA